MTNGHQTPREWTNNQKSVALGIAIVVVFLVGFGFVIWPYLNRPTSWVRPQPEATAFTVDRTETVNEIASRTSLLPIVLAMYNHDGLNQHYDLTCRNNRYRTWPTGDFCNDRLNLHEASTLTPQQTLYVPAGVPSPIEQDLMADLRPNEQVAIAVDMSRGPHVGLNLEYAAVLTDALQATGHLGGVWVYGSNDMFEYVDHSHGWAFNMKRNPGTIGALTLLTGMAYDKILLVTDKPVPPVTHASPVIGLCTTSSCEDTMKYETSQTRGSYIPFRG